MRRLVWIGAPILLTGLLAGALVVLPDERTRAVAAYLVALAVFAAAAELGRVRRSRAPRRSAFEAALVRPPTPRARLRELEHLEHDVAQALRNPRDVERRLAPVLREIAAHRLAARRGLAAVKSPEAMRAALGEEAWELVGPEATFRRPLQAAELERIVVALERV